MTLEMLKRKTEFNTKKGLLKLTSGLFLAVVATYLTNAGNYSINKHVLMLMSMLVAMLFLVKTLADEFINEKRLEKVNATEEEKKRYFPYDSINETAQKKRILGAFILLNVLCYYVTVRYDVNTLLIISGLIILSVLLLRITARTETFDGGYNLECNRIKTILSLITSALFIVQYFTGFMSSVFGF